MVLQPLVSIIVPTRNEERVIENCLRSLTHQTTEHPYEIILVDTLSDDKTLEIAEKYGVKVISDARRGKPIARQTGADNANGEILCFTEADCVVTDTWLSTIIRNFNEHPEAVAVTGAYTFINSTWYYQLAVRALLPLTRLTFWLYRGHNGLRATNFAIRATALKEIGGFNTITKELDDAELSMRVKELGKIIYATDMNIYTEDRRIRGRVWSFMKEFVSSVWVVIIRKEPMNDAVYEDVR